MPTERAHIYRVGLTWTGNLGRGTADYAAYSRGHEISIEGKPTLPGTSDPLFRGDPGGYTPEELLVASLAGCHMLWYLHLCADAGIVTVDYVDSARGTMREEVGGAGRFEEVVLAPRATIVAPVDLERARALHADAHRLCFISNSVNFPVRCEPEFLVADPGTVASAIPNR